MFFIFLNNNSNLYLIGLGSLMAVYHASLTGKVAEWAVHKQKLHWRVSLEAMILVHAVLNVN
jgi:hypothetical protein